MLEFEVKPDGFQSEFPMFVRFYKAGKADSGLRDLLPGVEFVIPPDAPKVRPTRMFLFSVVYSHVLFSCRSSRPS